MRLIHYVTSMILATIISFVGFFLVVLFMDPFTGVLITLVLFYSSLFLAVAGLFSLLGLLLESKIFRHELEIYKVKIALRQALWLALLLIASLWLQHEQLLSWRNMFILILMLLSLEGLFFLSFRHKT